MAKEYIEREAVAKKAICMHGFGNVKYVPLSAIMNQTAADVVEVVHGYWIEVTKNTSWKCSECGELSCCKANFCHNCGADMRERRDNNAAD